MIKHFLFLFFILPVSALAQNTYNMSTQTVFDCEGILLDSDVGQLAGYYDHNEDLIFTICITASDSILMTFGQFCTEAGFDILTIHDGSNIASPVLGTFSGTITVPPLMATSGCMTLHFVSDANVSCTGWQAAWTTFISPPEDPVFYFSPSMPTCSTDAVIATFTEPIPCDSVYPAAFEIDAPVDQTITSITPLNCTNGTATQFQFNLSPGLDQSGTYDFHFTYNFTDACFNEYILYADTFLSVNDCPLQVEMEVEDDLICPGTCTQITANVSGGNPGTYTYNWSNGLPNSAGPHWVCPTANTTYTVTVDDVGPSAPASASVTINLLTSPAAQADVSLCRNASPINLTANPSGGEWSGDGITDPSGIFNPDNAGGGQHTVYYTAPNGCVDSVIISVLPVNAGYDEAACPGTAAFTVSEFNPAGGIWSGSGITSGGVFNPTSVGDFTVTYTAPNGCTDTKIIHVANLSVQPSDTVCQSDAPFDLTFSPYGGMWSGTSGITNPFSGAFDPAAASVNNNVLVYTANGCSAQTEIFVKAINAAWDFAACPEQAPFQLTDFSPQGGTWTGTGITDPSGSFNPGATGGNFNSTLTYTLDGCTDQRIAYVIQTQLSLSVLEFCPDAADFLLDYANTGTFPESGNWTGTGIVSPFAPGIFSPQTAGVGTYTLTYTANTCSDSLIAIVHPFPTVSDTAVCELSGAFPLNTSPPGGTWTGEGVINNSFDPQLTGLGDFELTYTSLAGCTSTLNVNVYELASAEISGLDLFYCFTTVDVQFLGEPLGGTFSGQGVTDSVFNPALAGEGTHIITYSYGGGNCLVTDQTNVIVGAAIQPLVTISSDTICIGQYTTISVAVTGGDGNFNFQWLNYSVPGTTITVSPDTTSYYVMLIEDGCSDPVTDSIRIVVQPEFSAIITAADAACYNQPVEVSAQPSLAGNYQYHWDTSPPQSAQTINAPAGRDVELTLTNTSTGCSIDTVFDVPGFPFLQALFSLNPNLNCYPLENASMEFADLTSGADNGFWDFGDGTTLPFSPGIYPEHSYSDTGQFNASLIVMNTGGCTDTFTYSICVYPDYELSIPTAFTPNGDGLNEVFQAQGIGIHEFHMEVFNHWGERMCYINSLSDYWDGTFRGNLVPQGVYVWYAHVRVLVPTGTKFLRLDGMVSVFPGKH
jgi:gliding motility-associated-like protein